MARRKKTEVDRVLEELVRIWPSVNRALTRNARLSSRYPPGIRKAFREGEKAGLEIWAHMNGHRSFAEMERKRGDAYMRRVL